tara:strand:+ start:1598 stop:2290 length:693 start_codon:yes stop_codon:yes gene_type:complete
VPVLASAVNPTLPNCVDESMPLTLKSASAVTGVDPTSVETSSPETVRLEFPDTDVEPIARADDIEDKDVEAVPVTGIFVSNATEEVKLGAVPVMLIRAVVLPNEVVEDKPETEIETFSCSIIVMLPNAEEDDREVRDKEAPPVTPTSPIATAEARLGAIPVAVILTFTAPKVAVEDKDNEERSTLQVPVTVGVPTAVAEAIVLTVTDSTSTTIPREAKESSANATAPKNI